MHKLTSSLLSFFLAIVVFSASAQAKGQPDFTQFGRDIRIDAGEKAGELTCFNCSIYIRGEASGDATAFNGRIVVESGGSVAGEVTTLFGDVRIEPGANIAGEVTVMGGALRRESGAAVGGEVTSFENKIGVILILLSPFVILGLIIALIVWLIQRSRRTVPVTA